MGEIKSTLDLVMEKTKNLTLSAEEKQAQKQKDIESRIKGLMQKYQDGLLGKDQLKIDYESHKKEAELSDDSAMINEVVSRLDPNRDNQPLLELLDECCRVNLVGIQTIINEIRNDYLKAAAERKAQLKEELARIHAISGSAVVPNLETDAQWHREETALHRRFEGLLNQEKDKLAG